MTTDTPAPAPRRRKNHRVPLPGVLGFVELLQTRHLTDAFLAAAVEAKAVITLSEDTAAFIRDFLDRHERSATSARSDPGTEAASFAAAPSRAEMLARYCPENPDPYKCPIR